MALGEGKFDEGGARNRRGQAASQPSKRLNRVYHIGVESLSEQSGAERRHLVKCELVRREDCKKIKNKTKKKLASDTRGISLEECDERR